MEDYRDPLFTSHQRQLVKEHLQQLIDQESRQQLIDQESRKQPVDHNWTSARKKRSFITFEKDGVEKRISTMEYLKKLAAELPKVKDQNGRTVNHFENLRRRFMSGRNQEESKINVSEYCHEMEKLKKPIENTVGMKLFIFDETEWIAAQTMGEAIVVHGSLEDELDSCEEIPESRWNEEIEVYPLEEIRESEDPKMRKMTIWELMRPALESGKAMRILTEDI